MLVYSSTSSAYNTSIFCQETDHQINTPLSTDVGTNFDTVHEDQERDSKSTSQSLHEDDTDRVSLIEKWEILMDNLRCAWYYDRPFAADDDKA